MKKKKNEKFTIVFPASTVGRKGCYELREAVRGLDVKLITLGAVIESADFWQGFDVEKGSDNWLEKADLVVLPAFIEHKPRRIKKIIKDINRERRERREKRRSNQASKSKEVL